MRIAMSSGHGLHIRGASYHDEDGWGLDEVDEARKVVPMVAKFLRAKGVHVATFDDDSSTTQNENLETIVAWHNAQERDLDISVHFNAAEPTTGARGTEVWFATQKDLAADVSYAIAMASDLPDRGPKENGLYFLNNTDMPAILIEVVFVDAKIDCEHYEEFFDNICESIADAVAPDEDEGEEIA